jgi:two-component system, NtrC family, sensor histidine kinase GlrK
MWRFYPKSFPMLILAGFSLAVLPLIFALINNAISIHELSTKSQRAVYNAVQATQNSRVLIELLTGMERSARQYSILGEPELFNGFKASHNDFIDTVRRMRSLSLPREQATSLEELAQAEMSIYENVADLHDRPKELNAVVEHYQILGSLARSLDFTGAAIVSREIGSMQALSGDVHNFIYWQLVALVPVALFLVIGATILILKPIRQIEAALRRLGDGDFTHTVAVSGPRDLEALGRQLDWVRLRLIELEEQKTRFMRQISHELKTPLTAIRGYAEGLGEGAFAPEDAARTILVEARRLERLVRDLLDLARINRREFSVGREPVDLAEVVREAVARHDSAARSFGVDLVAEAEESWVEADPDRVLQIASNLIENALRETPRGGSVSVRSEPRRLVVADTGPGLEPDDLARAFDRFFLYDKYGRERPVGSGLGLAIVKQLAGAMGGSVRVESEPGAGAVFTLELPRSRTREPVPDYAGRRSTSAGPARP